MKRCRPTRVVAPDSAAKIADAREKNSMSITVSTSRERITRNARRKSIANVVQVLVADAQDVSGGHHVQEVEDGAIALEDAEEEVVAADAGGRARDGVLRQHRGSLLDELQEEDSFGRPPRRRPQPAHGGSSAHAGTPSQ